MNTQSIGRYALALAAAAALTASGNASDWGQSFYLSAPDSNPSSVIRFGEPAGTPPALPATPASPAALATPAAAPAPAAAPVRAALPTPAAAALPLPPDAPEAPPPPELDDRQTEIRADLQADAARIREQAVRFAHDGQRISEEVQRNVQRAIADVKRSAKDGKRMTVVVDGRRRARTLLLPADDASAEARDHLNEDLTVMHKILAKAAGRRKEADTFRIAFDRPESPELDVMYLDGYGVVFLLSVNFPLLEPEKPKTKAGGEDGAKDPVWEEARRKLKADTSDASEDLETHVDPSGRFLFAPGGDVVSYASADSEPYDADKVNTLKKKLTAALKHAANIRGLKPDETVTVVVTGRGPGPSGVGSTRVTRPMDPGGPQRYGVRLMAGGTDESPDAGQARLTLRAKKSDIDALAEGKVTAEEFPVKISLGKP